MARPRLIGGVTPAPAPDAASVELVRRVQGGDGAAFNTVVSAHWRRTVAYAFTLLDDRDLACDVAQEAMVRLWHSRARLDPERPIAPWLLKTTRNLCLNERRNLEVRWRWATRERDLEPAGPPTPLQDLESHEVTAAIAAAIKSLPSRRREAFTLFHIQKLTYREIAELMEVRPQSAANYVQAAIADLRTALADHFPDLAPP